MDPVERLDSRVAIVTGASRGIGAAVAGEGVRLGLASRTPDMPALTGMLAPTDVAEVVLFVLTRPRNQRILEVALRPVTETS